MVVLIKILFYFHMKNILVNYLLTLIKLYKVFKVLYFVINQVIK